MRQASTASLPGRSIGATTRAAFHGSHARGTTLDRSFPLVEASLNLRFAGPLDRGNHKGAFHEGHTKRHRSCLLDTCRLYSPARGASPNHRVASRLFRPATRTGVTEKMSKERRKSLQTRHSTVALLWLKQASTAELPGCSLALTTRVAAHEGRAGRRQN